MQIVYSEHAIKRMKQRGITELEIMHVLVFPEKVIKIHNNRKEAIGTVYNRNIKIIFENIENYIKIITVI